MTVLKIYRKMLLIGNCLSGFKTVPAAVKSQAYLFLNIQRKNLEGNTTKYRSCLGVEIMGDFWGEQGCVLFFIF